MCGKWNNLQYDKCRNLGFIQCDAVEIVSNSPKLIRLSVFDCPNLRDVSDITKLITFYGRHCPNLTIEEKTLQSVQYLWLKNECPTFPSHNITTYKYLKFLSIGDTNVVENEIWQIEGLLGLSFDNCRNIKVTRFPRGLKELQFRNCKDIPSIDYSQMPDLTALKFHNASITRQVIDSSRPLKSLIF